MTQSTLQDFESSGVECPTCGRDDFDSAQGMKWHHSWAHGESIAGVALECEYCGDTYRVKECRVQASRFCSNKCQQHQRSEDLDPSDYSSWKGGLVEKECAVCGEVFEVKQFREQEAKTCSYACSGKYRSENYNGSDSPHWRGGKSITDSVKKELSDSAWHTIAEEYRTSTARACEMCGTAEDKLDQRLDVHHIVPISAGGDNGFYNLMALCRSCHRSIEAYTRHELGFEPVLVE